MIKGYSRDGFSRLMLGTHLGDFTDEVSESYRDAIAFALQNGISSIDGAINYRGMRSEKDEGTAVQELISSGKLRREGFCAGYPVPGRDLGVSPPKQGCSSAILQKEPIRGCTWKNT